MNKDQAISKVNESVGSLFTKEDVIKLIEEIETEGGLDFNIEDFIGHIEDSVDDLDSTDVVDTASAEFELAGNQIMLESIEIDNFHIKSELGNAIRNFFDNK